MVPALKELAVQERPTDPQAPTAERLEAGVRFKQLEMGGNAQGKSCK